MTKNKNFLYGIGKVKFNGFEIGYIEKKSWNNNGKKPEVVEINAEQKPSAPVLVIPQTNGTIAPTFAMTLRSHQEPPLTTSVGSVTQ